jgi:hypothetical protein
VAWGRIRPAAWDGSGAAPVRSRTPRAPGRVACGQTQPRASAPARDWGPGAGRGVHLADPGAHSAAGQPTGHRANRAAGAVNRSRSTPASAGQPADRAAPASYPTWTGNPPVGHSADRHASAAGHPARRPVDHVPPAADRPGWAGAAADRPGWAGAAADRPGWPDAAAGRPAGHPVALSPGTAAGRSTGHPAVPRPGTAAGRSRNRSGRAPPARDPDTDCWRTRGAGASRVGASHRSACCALSPGQREITTSCGTQAPARRRSCPSVMFGSAARRSQRAGRW